MEHVDRELAKQVEKLRANHCKRDGDRWLCDCGAPIENAYSFSCPKCIQESEQRHREQLMKGQEAAHWKQVESIAMRPLIGAPDWEHAHPESPDFEKKTHPRLRNFVTKYHTRHGSVALLGPSGCGKTTALLGLFWRLANQAIELEKRRGWQVPDLSRELTWWSGARWVTAHQIVKARREHKLGAQADAPLVVDCMEASLLAIDELGFEPVDGSLFEIVDARYSKRQPTIVTSGLTSEEFAKRYGSAFLRRLREQGIGRLVEVQP